METSMNKGPYHSSSSLFKLAQSLTTKPSLAASTSGGLPITSTRCCPGPTTTSLCCTESGSYSSPTTTCPEIRRQSSSCPDCDLSSTPPQSLPISVTRIYPSPPLTGSALKKSVPLPEVNGGPVMGSVYEEDPQAIDDHAMSHDEADLSAALDLGFHPGVEPLSPPPTLTVSTHPLPASDLDTESPSSSSCASDSRLLSPTEDEAPLPPSKRLRRERQEIFVDSLPERSPASPGSPWGYQSEASGSSSTSPSFYRHDSSSSGWTTDSTEMDYSPHSTFPPDSDLSHSPGPKRSSLDLPLLPGLPSTYSDTYHTDTYHSDAFSLPRSSRSDPLSSGLLWFEPNHQDMDMAVDSPHLPPSSPRASFHLPFPLEPDSDFSYADTTMPPSEDDESLPSAAPPPTGQLFQPYPAFRPHEDFLYLTPAPRSPHASLSTLPDLYMDDVFEVPSSPHSPHSSLPEAFDEDTYPPPLDTISPSLLSHASETPNEGLGLFIQADPPLRRSPSPDDDLLQFIDIQLDPETSNLDVSEFIALRDLRKCALDAEREARNREASLNDRVTAAATALLPSTLVDDDIVNDLSEKRLRKHELHVAMDLRNVARQDRKREKQKFKEIGALLDVKMNGEYPAPFGIEPLGGMSQLVASMVMRRRETARSLANRKSAGQRPYTNSSLSFSVSSEDLHQADVDMGTE